MQQIKAFIRPQMLDAVAGAVQKLPAGPGLTISTVKGFSHRSGGRPAVATERIKLEMVVPDEEVEPALAAIRGHVRTGRRGGGKIFVTEVRRAQVLGQLSGLSTPALLLRRLLPASSPPAGVQEPAPARTELADAVRLPHRGTGRRRRSPFGDSRLKANGGSCR